MFNSVPLVYFCFYFQYSVRWVIEDLAVVYVIECSVYVFSKMSIVSGLTFRSLVHFEFIFVYGVRKCSNFILLHVVVQFSQHHLLKRLSLLHSFSRLLWLFLLLHSKGNLSNAKRQPSEWEKIIANETTDKGLISKLYKQLIQLNTR